ALLSSTSRRTDIPEADMPPRKRACLTAPGFEIGESSAAGATRQLGPTESDLRRCRALIARGVAAALAERDADRSRNGDNNNDSGTGGR
nr:hypothetical protein [Tanacetum cinerariifolium]